MPAANVELAFSGDTILMGGIGRTDFPCSSIEKMFESLHRLPKLISPCTTIICPTHDYNNDFSTTLESECSENEFLQAILSSDVTFEQFVEEKPKVDAGIADETNSELVCGLIKTCSSEDATIEIGRDKLKDFFQQHRESLIIDVREPHEFAFAQDWSELGFDQPPENVPLTRLAGYLPGLLASHRESPKDVIFLCRSGRRSSIAASVARRIGIDSARHIGGGIALNVKHKCSMSTGLNEDMGYMI